MVSSLSCAFFFGFGSANLEITYRIILQRRKLLVSLHRTVLLPQLLMKTLRSQHSISWAPHQPHATLDSYYHASS